LVSSSDDDGGGGQFIYYIVARNQTQHQHQNTHNHRNWKRRSLHPRKLFVVHVAYFFSLFVCFLFFSFIFFSRGGGGGESFSFKKQKEKLNEKEDMMSTKFSNGSHQQPRKSTSLPPSPCCLIDAQKCPLFLVVVVVFSF
jgi:ATP-dependent Zn protease